MDTTASTPDHRPGPERRPRSWKRAKSTCCALTATAATLAGLLGTAPAQAAPGPPGPPGPLQRTVERVRAEAGFVSLAVEVRDGGRRQWAGAGEAEAGTGRPVEENGSLRAASATKSFAAVVLLQLVAEDELSLDDPVEKWLPGVVSGHGNDGKRITVRNLLQHTSGIHNYDILDDFEDGDTGAAFERTRFTRVTPEQSVARAMRHKPDFPPADADDPEPDWNYSNPNFQLAGMLIKKITGHDWPREVRDRITRPLGLRHTYAPSPGDPYLPEPYAHTYQTFPDTEGWTDTSVRSVRHAGAAGALISTEGDLERFFTSLVRGELLPPRQFAQMRRTVPVNESFQEVFPGMEYGLGLMRNELSCDERYLGHSGDIEGVYVWDGVTENARRSVVIHATGKSHEDKKDLKARRLIRELADAALCGDDSTKGE